MNFIKYLVLTILISTIFSWENMNMNMNAENKEQEQAAKIQELEAVVNELQSIKKGNNKVML